jgi:hypothetical protein
MMDAPITERAIARAKARSQLGENALLADKDTMRTGRTRWGKAAFRHRPYHTHQGASGVQPGWRM